MAKQTSKRKGTSTAKKNNEKPQKEPQSNSMTDDDIQDVGYDPLMSEPITKKPYTVPKVDTSQLPPELEEPVFTPPSLDDFDEDEDEEEPKDRDTDEPKQQKSYQDFNPQFSELPNKDKKRAAEQMADIVIDGYSRLGKGMGALAKISEDKMSREIADGNIDPNISLPIDEMGNTSSVTDFVKEFNAEADEAFETTDEFKENVRPPLVRVFQKRGIGLTDEQLLVYYFGVDLGTKGITLFQLKKASNGILENLRAQTEMIRDRHAPKPEPAPSSPPPDAPSPSSPTVSAEFEEPEETEPIIVEDDLDSIKSSSGFAENPKDGRMPEFGDPDLLKDMEKLARREEEKKSKKKKK